MNGASKNVGRMRSTLALWWAKKWFRDAMMPVAVAIALRIVIATMSAFGLYLGIGNSLQPQVSWLSISREVPLEPGEFPQVGHMYSYRRPWGTAITPMARMVQRLGWRQATKWCWSVDEETQTWSTVTDDLEVPVSSITGEVIAILDYNWFIKRWTTGGRLFLWSRINDGPTAILCPNNLWVAVANYGLRDGRVKVCSKEGSVAFFDIPGLTSVGWEGEVLVALSNELPKLSAYHVESGGFVVEVRGNRGWVASLCVFQGGRWSHEQVQVERARTISVRVNGRIYLVGGAGYYGGAEDTLQRIEGGRAVSVANIPTVRSSFSATDVGSRIIVVGGVTYNNISPSNIVEVYNPKTDVWSRVADLPTPRSGLAAVTAHGLVYAIGGIGGESVVEVYNPKTDVWSRVTDLPTPRSGLAAVTAHGLVYAIGGIGGESVVEVYNPKTDVWSRVADLPVACATCSAFVGGGVVTVIAQEKHHGGSEQQ